MDLSKKVKAAQSDEPADPDETRQWLKDRGAKLLANLFDAEAEEN